MTTFSLRRTVRDHPITKAVPQYGPHGKVTEIHLCVTNFYRNVFRSGIRQLAELHRMGRCFSRRTEFGGVDDVSVDWENEKMVFEVESHEIDENEEGGKGKDSMIGADMLKFSAIIRRVFEMGDVEIPSEFEDLLSTLSHYRISEDDFVSNHLAVLNSLDRIDVVRSFQERKKILFLSNNQIFMRNFNKVMNQLPQWDLKAFDLSSNHHLGAATDVFYFLAPSWGENVRLEDSLYVVAGKKQNAMVLKLCRDLCTHITDHIAQYTPRGSSFTEEDMDNAIFMLFSEFLLRFQRLAHRAGILSSLRR